MEYIWCFYTNKFTSQDKTSQEATTSILLNTIYAASVEARGNVRQKYTPYSININAYTTP